jgi:hypothetical protein
MARRDDLAELQAALTDLRAAVAARVEDERAELAMLEGASVMVARSNEKLSEILAGLRGLNAGLQGMLGDGRTVLDVIEGGDDA